MKILHFFLHSTFSWQSYQTWYFFVLWSQILFSYVSWSLNFWAYSTWFFWILKPFLPNFISLACSPHRMMPSNSWGQRSTCTSSDTCESSQPHLSELSLMQYHMVAVCTWKRGLTALFCINELTDAHCWLESFWLSGVILFFPPREHGQEFSLGLPVMDDCGVVGILSTHSPK